MQAKARQEKPFVILAITKHIYLQIICIYIKYTLFTYSSYYFYLAITKKNTYIIYLNIFRIISMLEYLTEKNKDNINKKRQQTKKNSQTYN